LLALLLLLLLLLLVVELKTLSNMTQDSASRDFSASDVAAIRTSLKWQARLQHVDSAVVSIWRASHVGHDPLRFTLLLMALGLML
jgi:hypothetical protein